MSSQEQVDCPVCGGNSRYLDTLEGNRSCEDRHGLTMLTADWLASYYLCSECQHCFAPELCTWTDEQFRTQIYNAEYAQVDPDYLEIRPQANARLLQQTFRPGDDLRHLDYGGGDGRLSELLVKSGWSSISYDPFHGKGSALAVEQRFSLVTAFEVFEHAPNPHQLIKKLKSYLANPGLIIFSTLLSDGNIAAGKKLDWWYAAPRNGHISLYSRESLVRLAQAHGLHFISFSSDLHAFWSELPAWAAHLISQPVQSATEEAQLRARVQSNPSDHVAWHALGLLAFNNGNTSLAIQCIEAAIALNAKTALYQRNIGEIYRRFGDLAKAAKAGRQAVKLAPRDLDALYNLGLVHTDLHDYTKAIQCYRKALKINPRHGLSWNNLGSALEQQGEKLAALEAYEQAIAINSQHAEAQNNAGAIFSEQGRLDQARACFQAAIDAKPDFVEAHYNLSSFKTYKEDDPHLGMLERVYAQRHSLSDHARIRYVFALGKALDDTGDYDRAFSAYDEGNRLQHALLPLDERRADALLAQIMRVFNKQFFAERQSWQGMTDPERTPIFIVGMPRSGTTLLEQILCSHPSVYGAGELVDLNAAIFKVTSLFSGELFNDDRDTLSEAQMKSLGADYLDRVWQRSPESRFITDKMPANFFYLGFIHLALPGAKIIHAMRDPMDSCFSCFSRLFNDTMEFAYDQGTLGRYYSRYITLMNHWQQVLPPGTILDLPYEHLVADTENQARRVLEFVGLPWDAACLNFHKNTRLVKTASVAQVRKPIYNSSVGRWKNFVGHLQPLLTIVKPFRNNDDLNNLPQTTAATSHAPATANQRANQLHLQGIEHYRNNRIEEALVLYDQALALRPDFSTALNSKGFALQDQDRIEEALGCFERALVLDPEFAMARLNLGLAQLKLGKWQAGWENYEARWVGSAEAGNGTLNRLACPLPFWNGEGDTGNKSLLIITEQGFGDTFQFARYLPLVGPRFAKIGFACSAPTLRLMEWSFGEQVVTFTRMPVDFDTWDLQCSLMSLPRAFATRIDTIPAQVPYLRVPEKVAAHWRERLDKAAPGRLRIGIAWAGRKAHQYDARRSLSFNQIAPLLQDERVTWVSLQKWAPEDSRPMIPEQVDWLDWTEELTDFADTAALLSHLDLVISIDSSMVHLAGALGRPTWMMDRFDSEWRWLRHRTDSPWYPTLRIFRQSKFGDWSSVLQQVQTELAAMPAPRNISPRKQRPKLVVQSAQSATVLLTANSLSIEQAMQLASQQQSAGRLAEAEQLLRQILQQQPRHAHALHLLGVVIWQGGQQQQALALIEQALGIQENVALFNSNFAEMNRQAGNIDVAIRHGERAVALDASMASAHSNLGIAYYDAKNYEQAEVCHQQALALAPQLLQSLNNLGSIARARKDLSEAANWYRKALALQPDYLESLSNLGAVLVEDDKADAAEPSLIRALQFQPNYPEALCNLGLVRLKQERSEESSALLQRSLQLRPDYPEALIGLARAYHEQDRLDEAESLLRQATQHAPDKADAWCQLGSICTEQGNSSQAEAAYQQALALDSQLTDALTGLGNLRLEQGAIDEAERLLREAIALDDGCLAARFHLVQVKKIKEGDENVMALEATLLDQDDLSAEKRISLHYALGKAYDDQKAYATAFPHFIEGARLKRAKLHYDANADALRMQRIAEVYNSDLIQRLGGSGARSTVPVFVLGMPRSGTTLTEQIIASHPDVFGAGELRDLMEIAQQGAESPLLAYPDNLLSLNSATLNEWGEQYVQRLTQRAPDAKRITDKMPANYLALGLIPLMLPNARIIHVRRNPVDTCVSCFTRLFNRHQDATYDLYELGRHYANYARLMQHWRSVLPEEAFLEVQYEDIVEDMEKQARRLIDWVGLDWNDACLAFHKNQRPIRTASVTQVRQPIYTSSVERWRHYQAFLGPLLEGLGEFAPRE